jgi:nucleoside-diphosphate-sugar epimerase
MADVLVTGASGFIGRHVVAHLQTAGHVVAATSFESGDVADEATWERAPPTAAVVHLAGRSFVPESWEQPAGFVRTNVLGTINALEYCRRHDASLVYLSSYLYGHPHALPIPESAPLLATNPYALSKKHAEDACRFFAEHYSLAVTVLRIFNVYGPGQPEPFLIPSLLRQIVEGKEIVVQDLEPRRDYVYIDDVVQAIAKALATGHGYRVVNIGTGTSHSVAELVNLVQDTWRSALPVRSRNVRRKDEIMDTVADVRAARELLGWQPKFTLAAGLRAMYAARAGSTSA